MYIFFSTEKTRAKTRRPDMHADACSRSADVDDYFTEAPIAGRRYDCLLAKGRRIAIIAGRSPRLFARHNSRRLEAAARRRRGCRTRDRVNETHVART